MRVVTNSDYDGILVINNSLIFLKCIKCLLTFKGKANITNSIKQVSNPESLMFGYGVSINFAGKLFYNAFI
jgi:hypothetical protein